MQSSLLLGRRRRTLTTLSIKRTLVAQIVGMPLCCTFGKQHEATHEMRSETEGRTAALWATSLARKQKDNVVDSADTLRADPCSVMMVVQPQHGTPPGVLPAARGGRTADGTTGQALADPDPLLALDAVALVASWWIGRVVLDKVWDRQWRVLNRLRSSRSSRLLWLR